MYKYKHIILYILIKGGLFKFSFSLTSQRFFFFFFFAYINSNFPHCYYSFRLEDDIKISYFQLLNISFSLFVADDNSPKPYEYGKLFSSSILIHKLRPNS